MAAVVGSLDGCAGQYATHMSAQDKKDDVSLCLKDAMTGLIKAFKDRNHVTPKNIIVFRGGVSEGQYQNVLNFETEAIRESVVANGGEKTDVKISFIICSKRHSTRLVFDQARPDAAIGNDYVNLCSGVCVDATTGADSIVSHSLHEFYLNSHAAIQGT